MTDHIDHAGESPGPDRAPGQGGRHWLGWMLLAMLLVAGCATIGVLLLLLAIYIGRSRQEST